MGQRGQEERVACRQAGVVNHINWFSAACCRCCAFIGRRIPPFHIDFSYFVLREIIPAYFLIDV